MFMRPIQADHGPCHEDITIQVTSSLQDVLDSNSLIMGWQVQLSSGQIQHHSMNEVWGKSYHMYTPQWF